MRYEVNAVIQEYAVYLFQCASMQINLVLQCCCCCCLCWVAQSLVRSDAWSLGRSVGRSGGRSVGGGGGGSGSGDCVRSLAAFATLREQLWAPRHDIWDTSRSPVQQFCALFSRRALSSELASSTPIAACFDCRDRPAGVAPTTGECGDVFVEPGQFMSELLRWRGEPVEKPTAP